MLENLKMKIVKYIIWIVCVVVCTKAPYVRDPWLDF